MAWGNEEDVDKIVRVRLQQLRTKHKAEITKLKIQIAKLRKKIELLQSKDQKNVTWYPPG